MQTSMKPDAHVEMTFKAQWPMVLCVRKFLSSFFLLDLSSRERAGRIAMAASELLENATKYSSNEHGLIRIAVTRRGGEIDLVVENPADTRQIEVLRREIVLINSMAPEEIYLKRMHEASQAGAQGRLGLARIRFAAGARLHLETGKRTVTVHAIFSRKEA